MTTRGNPPSWENVKAEAERGNGIARMYTDLAAELAGTPAPDGYYRDEHGVLHRQHDTYGGPHDEPASKNNEEN